MEKSESIVKLSKALVKMQSEMGAASKSSDNPFFKNLYCFWWYIHFTHHYFSFLNLAASSGGRPKLRSSSFFAACAFTNSL